jgi:hypothetical protein
MRFLHPGRAGGGSGEDRYDGGEVEMVEWPRGRASYRTVLRSNAR